MTCGLDLRLTPAHHAGFVVAAEQGGRHRRLCRDLRHHAAATRQMVARLLALDRPQTLVTRAHALAAQLSRIANLRASEAAAADGLLRHYGKRGYVRLPAPERLGNFIRLNQTVT